jgi:hypothetical protein
VDGGPDGVALTVRDIKQRIAVAHQIPTFAISLFQDPQHTRQYENDDYVVYQPQQQDIVKIYWAFIGDAPDNWFSKRHEATMAVDNLLLQITEQLNTSTFSLEREYFEGSAINNVEWANVNALPRAEIQPALPINIPEDLILNDDVNSYAMIRERLEHAAFTQNPHWRKTLEKILARIIRIRVDKEQYHVNLRALRDNDLQLRDNIRLIIGEILPPFPNPSLYSSIFHTPNYQPSPVERSDLTFRALTSAIEQNKIYYHQELGKYNQLKKDECHLIERYHQIQTRMKLWIIRERIRLVAWELMYAEPNPYDDEELKLELKELYNPPKYNEKMIDWTRTYQCIDFCQCEAESSTLKIAPPPQRN